MNDIWSPHEDSKEKRHCSRSLIEEVIDIRAISISNMPLHRKTTLKWYFPVFVQIAEMHRNPNSSPGRELASGLQRLGLGTFVQDAWKWQHEALCDDFVRNFNHAKMNTTAFGTEVDLSFGTFASLTGLSSDEGDKLYPEEEPCLEDFAPSWRMFFGNDAYDPRSKGFALTKCRDSNVRLLIEIINDTAWMRRLPRKYKHAPKDLVYLMCHCVEKKRRVNWGKTIHKKFVEELTRLYMTLFSNKEEKPTSRAGPLMCFLFAQFMDPVRQKIEGSSDDLSDLFSWERSANSQEKIFRESSELLAEMPLAEKRWDEERESRSSWEEVLIGTDEEQSITGDFGERCGQKRSLSTAVDDNLGLVDSNYPMRKVCSTFAELYIEEQKHAEECLKAKLEAERMAESLRAELVELKRHQQQSGTAASLEEQFAKHQVIVLRQRLEESILERDEARAENKYLKMQLKGVTTKVKNPSSRHNL